MHNPVATAIASGWIITLDEANKAGVSTELTGALAQAAAHAAYLLISGEDVAGVKLADQTCSDEIIQETLGNKWAEGEGLGEHKDA